MGPYLVTADEVKDPNNLQVRLWVNGTLMQNYNTSDMAHKNPALHRMGQLDPSAGAGRRAGAGTNHRGLNRSRTETLVELETEPLGRLACEDPR